MSENRRNTDKATMDLKLNILSPRQRTSLLTSVSQILTPTNFTPLYTSNTSKPDKPRGILHRLSSSDTSTKNSDFGQPFEIDSDNSNCGTQIDGDSLNTESAREANLEEVLLFCESTPGNGSKPPGGAENQAERDLTNNSLKSDNTEIFLESLERQIIFPEIHTENKMDRPDLMDVHDLIVPTKGVHIMDKNQQRSIDSDPNPSGYHSHASSFSGNSSTGEPLGLSVSSRGSVCDEHGSLGSLNQHLYSNSVMHTCQTMSEPRTRNWSDKSEPFSDFDQTLREDRPRDVYTNLLTAVDSSVQEAQLYGKPSTGNPPFQCDSHHVRQRSKGLKSDCSKLHEYAPSQHILGNFVVMATWLQLIKYRDLQAENWTQKKAILGYERKVESLIRIVLVLLKQTRNSTSDLQNIQVQMNRLKERQISYEKRFRMVYFGLTCLLAIHLLQISSFRTRCLSIIQFFGIFEMVEKVNRTRKVVSKNWRNIPSLLTDFWRIFIFRSRSQLHKRLS